MSVKRLHSDSRIQAIVDAISTATNESYTDLTTEDMAELITNMSNSLIANWDFTKSLSDTKNGYTFTTNNITRSDTDGLIFSAESSYARLSNPTSLIGTGRAFEIDFGDCDNQGAYQGRVFGWNANDGFIFRTNSIWSQYNNGGWSPNSGITDGNYFDNSTLRIEYDYNRNMKYYKNGTLFYTCVDTKPVSPEYLGLGSSSGSFYNMNIKALRVYIL